MKILGFILGIVLLVLSPLTKSEAYPLNDVRFEGLPSELLETTRSVLGIFPGDEYDSSRIERAREKLIEYLQSKGYPTAKVSMDSVKKADAHVLQVQVKTGNPLKIKQIAVFSKEESLSPELTQRLMQAADLRSGEIFDRDRIKDMKRSIETVMTGLNFIDSRVKDVAFDLAAEGVTARFRVELGERVVLSVHGSNFYSRNELMEIINAQRALGLGRDYISVITNRIREDYIEHGFRQIKITPFSFEAMGKEPKKVVFEIEEGIQSQIKSVEFEGNEQFSGAELRDLFFRVASDRIQSRIYNGKMVDSAANAMIEELKKMGYLSAKLIAVKTEEIPKSAALRIRCFLSEGLQTRVQSIDFRGNQIFDLKHLQEWLGISEGEPLSLPHLEDGLDRIKREYRNLGYLDFKISNENGSQVVTYSEKNQFAYITIDMDEGAQYLLGKFDIFGNEMTKRRVIERELRLLPGEPLGESRIIEAEERLRRLGIFNQVSAEITSNGDSPTVKNMKITVQEAIPGNGTAGIGFRNDLGVRTFMGLSYQNLWGLNHTWALDLTANRRLSGFRFFEYTAQVSYTLPWAFAGPTTFRPSISAEKRQYLEFDAETFGFNSQVERMLYSPIKLSGSVLYTLERVRQFNAVDATQNQQITIGSVTPTLRVDLRDNSLAPKRGFFGMTSFEFADSFLGTQTDPVPVSYGRLQARTDYYFNFIPRTVWYCSVRGGWLRNFVSPYLPNGSLDPRVTVPLIKQFALGGVNSIRGFEEQALNVQASDSNRRVQGYLTYVNYRTQLDFYATQSLTLGPFLDAGNLQLDTFSFGQLRLGSGVGLRYITPVGPVNFDWGFKIKPLPSESSNVFYFSLGVI